jgi:hypothetical protein
MASFPKEWLEEWQRLSDLIYGLTEKYAGQLVVRITDAQSPQGLWAGIRRGIRKYPTFVVAGDKYTGLDEAAVEAMVARHLPAAG